MDLIANGSDKISFIIIGRNESKNITKCVESIKKLSYHNYEIIYIDSSSTDDSQNILSKYDEVKSYKITSNIYTAALARDIGVDISTGGYIFFIDGDMEILPDADLLYCLNLLNGSNISIVSGDLDNLWTKDGLLVRKISNFYDVRLEVENLKSPGGYFLTKKSEYIMSGRFDKKLSCNEEVDLFSRYKKREKRLIRTKKLHCLHNNIEDNKEKSHLTKLRTGYYVGFWKAISNAFRNGYIKEYLKFKSQIIMIRSISITLMMIIFILISVFSWVYILIPFVYYLLLFFRYKFNIKLLVYNQLNNIMIILSLIFIFKKNNLEYKVEIVDNCKEIFQ